MTAVPGFLDPRKNPFYQAWEKTSARLTETALTDPFFLSVSSSMLKGMLTAVKMQEQWWSMVTTGGVPTSTRNAETDAMRARLEELEARVERYEAEKGRSKKARSEEA